MRLQLTGKGSHLYTELDDDWYQFYFEGGVIPSLYDEHYAAYNGEPVHQQVVDYCYKKQKGFVVDHINGDRLDNRRKNLRVVSIAENSFNRHRLSTRNQTGITGLCYDPRRKKWRVTLTKNNKVLYSRRISDYEEAKAIAEFHNAIRTA